MNNLQRLDHLNMTVDNFEASAAWYGRVFGFAVVERGVMDGQPWGVLRHGDTHLCIYQAPGRRVPDATERRREKFHGLSHFALQIADRADWERTVLDQNLEVRYGGAVRWPRSTSWYILDPTGYEIEVVHWTKGRSDFSQQGAS